MRNSKYSKGIGAKRTWTTRPCLVEVPKKMNEWAYMLALGLMIIKTNEVMIEKKRLNE